MIISRIPALIPVAATGTALMLAALGVPATSAAPLAGSAQPGDTRWIGVSVATVWGKPGLDRPVDARSTASPADPGGWLAGLTLTQRKWLYGKLETQALYGDQVQVLGESGTWTRIAVLDQPTPKSAVGYPGWIPTAQLASTAAPTSARTAVVSARTARAFADAALTDPVMVLSYGTRLPVTAVSDGAVSVAGPDDRALHLSPSAVTLVDTSAKSAVTGTQVAAQARKFLGLQYLWGGTSGFGYDCSGLTYAVYDALGITIPRDAGPQFRGGRKITRAKLAAGDLVFFRNATGIHHVGMYIGRGKMIHSPRTGRPVVVASLRAQPYAREYAGARRYVG